MTVNSNNHRMVAHYQLGKTIGSGAFGSVELARDTMNNNTVAIKFIVKDKDPNSIQNLLVQNETNAMVRVRSEHCCKLYAYNKSTKYPRPDGSHVRTTMLVTEFCPGGNLFDNIFHAQRMDELLARTYFRQLVKGLQDCHRVGVVHRDIKAQNVMFDANCKLKIIDFGFAHLKQNLAELIAVNYICGTRGYQAPEILSRTPTTGFGADVFAAGVLLFVMLAGHPPFEHATKTDKWYNSVYIGDYNKFWQKHRGCPIPHPAKRLISAMIHRNPQQRIKLADIKRTPWYNGEVLSDNALKAVMHERIRRCQAPGQATKNQKATPRGTEHTKRNG